MANCWRLRPNIFDVFIMVDRNLAFQQNIAALPIAVIVLSAKSNRLADLKPLVPRLLTSIETIKPSSIELIGEK